MRRRTAVVVALLVAGAVGGTAPATGAPNVVVAVGSEFLPREVVIVQGTELTFVNADALSHDVTSFEDLFSSDTIGMGATPVDGVASLAPNTYSFYCTVHSGMRGLLTVV